MRYQHLLYRAAGDAQPAQIACLDCDYIAEPMPGESRRTTMLLRQWSAVCAAGRGGVYGAAAKRSGTDAGSFWSAVEGRLKCGGALWLFAPSASTLCAIMGLWRRIDSGEMYVDGRDHRSGPAGHSSNVPGMRQQCGAIDERAPQNSTSGVPGVRRMSGSAGNGPHQTQRQKRPLPLGYAVLEDPPFVLDLRMRGLPGKLRILDVANYGLEIDSAPIGVLDRARRIYEFVTGMVSVLVKEGMGSLKATVGSQSYYSFRRKYLSHMVECHADDNVLRLESCGYYGGRCEAFRLGRLPGRVYHLDVSSMYPSLYRHMQLPAALLGWTDKPDAGFIADCLANHYAIARVTIETGQPAYPYRDERRKLVVYPVGRFATTLAGSELLHAYKSHAVVAWHAISWYGPAPFLARFGARIWALQRILTGYPDLRGWIKRLGVCVVGKLGQRDKGWVDATSDRLCLQWDAWEEKDELSQWHRWRCFAGCTQREDVGGFAPDAIPAAACAITSAARIKLLDYLNCAGWNNVWYVDTDALMCNERGYRRLLNAGHIGTGEWGLLKIEGVYDNVTIRGIKDYVADGKMVSAGTNQTRLAGQSDQDMAIERIGLAGFMRGRREPNAMLVTAPRQRTGIYRHGNVRVTGEVEPFFLGREEYGKHYRD